MRGFVITVLALLTGLFCSSVIFLPGIGDPQSAPNQHITPVYIAQSELEFALEMVKSEIVQYDAIKKGIIEPDRCEECAYCRETKMLTEVIESDSSLI